MGKFSDTLLASDFDGTLKNDNGTIDEQVLLAIKYFQRQGGYFTLSTGRSLQGLSDYDLSLYNAPLLLANGAFRYDPCKKTTFSLDGIEKDIGVPFIKDIQKQFPDLSIEMYALGSTYAINLSDSTHRHFSCQGIKYYIVDSPDKVDFPLQKIMLGGSKQQIQFVQQYMLQHYDNPSFLPTDGTILEVLQKGVDKGTGLLKLACQLQVPFHRVFAVGDGYNDKEMLLAAYKSFVPENGDLQMKNIADFVVRSNNDGAVADVIAIIERIINTDYQDED